MKSVGRIMLINENTVLNRNIHAICNKHITNFYTVLAH
jgi:hypothetical protein